MRRLLLAFAALILLTGPARALEFRAQEEDPSARRPTLCALFDRTLDPEGVTPGDFVTTEPAADLGVMARGRRLCLHGLEAGGKYRVTVRPGLPALDGTRLTAPVTFEATMADPVPLVGFAGEGFILPREGTAGLGLETLNVPAVRLRLYRASDRLLSRLTIGADPGQWELTRLTQEDLTLVWQGQMDTSPPAGTRGSTAIPLEQALAEATGPKGPGAWLVVAGDATIDPDTSFFSSDWDGRLDARWVVHTDLGITAFTGSDGLTLSLRSLDTAEPLGQVRVVLVARDNSILGEKRTDSDGLVRFDPGLLRGSGGARPVRVMAYGGGGDFGLLDLTRPGFDFSDRGVSGRPDPGPVDGYAWTDRGIYRPGETVHLALLLRDRSVAALSGRALTVTLRRPDGRVSRTAEVVTDATGAATLSLPLTRDALRGEWELTAAPTGSNDTVARTRLTVEDFVPQRLAVSLDTPTIPLLPVGEPVTLTGSARFLYGAPAAGLPVGADLRLEADDAPFPRREGWHFGPPAPPPPGDLVQLSLPDTGAAGEVTVPLNLQRPTHMILGQPMRAQIAVAVTEPGGRTTDAALTMPVRPDPMYLGIKPRFRGGSVREGEEAAFDIAALDPTGTPLDKPGLEWSLVRIERDWIWYQSGRSWNWRIRREEVTIARGHVDTTAETPATLSRRLDWGQYRLVVSDQDTGQTSALEFHVGWYGGDDDDAPDRLSIALDKDAYAAGETARLRIEPPFPGRVQIVIAGDRIHRTIEREVGAEPVTVEIPVDPGWRPGVHALATLYRGTGAAGRGTGDAAGSGAPRPVRAVGVAWIGTDNSDRTLPVTIDLPEMIRPRQRLEVPVTVAGLARGETAHVTLAAVDEGILALTGFKSPDPAAHFFARRQLGVTMRDDYGKLLDGDAGPAGTLRQGGDGAGLGGAGLPVVPVRSVALFSGVVPVGDDGTVRIPVEVPDFAGTLRVMVVAASARGVGRADHPLIVRDPLVAEVILPRFLAPGDRAQATLLLHNVDGPEGPVRLSLAATAPLSLETAAPLPVEPTVQPSLETTAPPAAPETAPPPTVGGVPGSLTLAVGEKRELPIPLTATGAGIAALSLTVEGPDGTTVTRDWPITIRPAHPPVVLAGLAAQGAGEAFSPDPLLFAPFQPGTASLSLSYSRLPGIDVPGLVRDLDIYPHGCTEQIISRTLPLLALTGAEGLLPADRPGGALLRLDEAVERILDRQRADGGFGLWGWDYLAGPWVEAYAVDFLTRAAAAGQPIPPHALDGLRRSLQSIVRDNLTGSGLSAEVAAYGLYLQTRMGEVSMADLRYLHDTRVEQLGKGPMAFAHLGAAFAAVGDSRRSGEAFARARERLGQAGADFHAGLIRDAAATLTLAAEAGETQTITAAMGQIQSLLQQDGARGAGIGGIGLSTVEKGWLLLAAQAMLARTGDPVIQVDGITPVTLSGTVSLAPDAADLERGITITNTGDQPVYRSMVLRGVPTDPPPPTEQGGLTLNKLVFDMDGMPVDTASQPRNSRLIVVLTGTTRRHGERTLVLVDPLPAGWEIEAVLAPGAGGYAQPRWIGELTRGPVREARDDRFVAVVEAHRNYYDDGYGYGYGDSEQAAFPRVLRGPRLSSGQFRFAYVVRTVTPGDFALPPATVEDMYDSLSLARTGSGRTVVTAP